MIQLAVLPLALALSAATPPVQAAPALVAAVAAEDGASVQNVQDAPQASGTVEEAGFMEKYYPFSFTPEEAREPETNDNFVVLYLSGFLHGMLLANVWLPIVVIGNPDGFIVEQIIGTIVHYIPVVCFPIAPLVYVANVLYLIPVQTVNTFDRTLKAAKRGGTWQSKAASADALRPKEAEVASLGAPVMAF